MIWAREYVLKLSRYEVVQNVINHIRLQHYILMVSFIMSIYVTLSPIIFWYCARWMHFFIWREIPGIKMSFNGNIMDWWIDGKYYLPANWAIEQQTNHTSLKHAVKNYFASDTLPFPWERRFARVNQINFCLRKIFRRRVVHDMNFMLTLMECVKWLRGNHWTRGIVHMREHTMRTRSHNREAPRWNHFCVLKLCQEDNEFYLLDSRDGSSIKAAMVPADKYNEECGFVCHSFEVSFEWALLIWTCFKILC